MTKTQLVEHIEWCESMVIHMHEYAAKDADRQNAKDILFRDNDAEGRKTAYAQALKFLRTGREKTLRKTVEEVYPEKSS